MVGMLSPRENVYSAGVQNTGMTSIDEKDQGNDLSATGKPTRFPAAYWTLFVVAEPKKICIEKFLSNRPAAD
jgi:hypothetical protein